MKESIIDQARSEAVTELNILIDTQLRPLYEAYQSNPARYGKELKAMSNLLIAAGAFLDQSTQTAICIVQAVA